MRRCFSYPSTPPDRRKSSGQLSSHEYTRAIQTVSFKETWHTIHCQDAGGGEPEEGPVTPPSSPQFHAVLRPDRVAIAEALGSAPRSPFTDLAHRFFERSELASQLSLSLQRAVELARFLYAPLHAVLDTLPDDVGFTPSDCSSVHDALVRFHRQGNPFLAPDLSSRFLDLRRFFHELREDLKSRLDGARRRRTLLRRVTTGSALVLIGGTVGLAAVGVVIATHGVAALAAGPVAAVVAGPGDLLAARRRKAREEMRRLEDAVSGTYVVDSLEGMMCLAKGLGNSVDSDRFVVENLGLRCGGGERLVMEEVARRLRRNRQTLRDDLRTLEEHVCLFCLDVNRARALLLRHLLHPPRRREGSSPTP